MSTSEHPVTDPEHVAECSECQRFHEEANRLQDEWDNGEDFED